MKWTRSDPVYPVADVAVAIDWHARVLGFAVTLVNPPGEEVPVYAIRRREAVSVHLLRKGDAPYGLTSPPPPKWGQVESLKCRRCPVAVASPSTHLRL